MMPKSGKNIKRFQDVGITSGSHDEIGPGDGRARLRRRVQFSHSIQKPDRKIQASPGSRWLDSFGALQPTKRFPSLVLGFFVVE
jgi:hypothetical protein